MGDLLSVCQRLLDGPYRHMTEAHAACLSGHWAEFTRTSAPERPVIWGRSDWSACVELASKTFSGPTEATVTIIPAWACSADEEPSKEWIKVHAVLLGRTGASSAAEVDVAPEELFIAEPGPYFAQDEPVLAELVTARAHLYEVGWVVATEAYAPSVELMVRRGPFGVLSGRLIRLVQLERTGYRDRASASCELPPPAVDVPPFCQWFEVRVSDASPTTAAAIARLSITVDERGNFVDRPAPSSD